MLKFAARNLMSRPVRSALSLLGLTVAIAGMVGLFAVKGGLEKAVTDSFRLIPGLTVMQPGAPVPLFSKLPAKWGDEMAELDGVAVVNPQLLLRANLIEGQTIFNPPRFLLGLDLPSRMKLKQDVYADHLVEGRFLTLDDRGTVNVVISRPIGRQFNKSVGDDLHVDGMTLHIVGMYDTNLPLLDVAILVDIEQLRKTSRSDPNMISVFYVEQTGPDVNDEDLKNRIKELFKDRSIEQWRPTAGNLAGLESQFKTGNPLIDAILWLIQRFRSGNANPGEAEPFTRVVPTADGSAVEVRTGDDWAARLDEFSADLDIFLGIMTGIGMTIALLSIVNTMLMSVTERMIEFGILKANGWSRRDVLKLITLESGAIGVAGGILGAILGWIVTQGLNAYWPDKLNLYAGPGLLSFSVVFAAVVGVLGGLYPAMWAMRMLPMDAIRRG